MDGKELKQRLEQAKRDDKDLALEKAHKEIERLAKLLNEAEKPKPKLRHGDYGIYKNSGSPWWVWKRNGVLELFGRSCGSGSEVLITSDMEKRGNCIADLQALAEPLEEFRVGGGEKLGVKIWANDYIEFKIHGMTATMLIAEADSFLQ